MKFALFNKLACVTMLRTFKCTDIAFCSVDTTSQCMLCAYNNSKLFVHNIFIVAYFKDASQQNIYKKKQITCASHQLLLHKFTKRYSVNVRLAHCNTSMEAGSVQTWSLLGNTVGYWARSGPQLVIQLHHYFFFFLFFFFLVVIFTKYQYKKNWLLEKKNPPTLHFYHQVKG